LKVAIVEFGLSHDECILTQLKSFVEHNDEVVLCCQHKLWERNPFFHSFVSSQISFIEKKSWFLNFITLIKLKRRLKKIGVKKIIFNTAQGGLVRDFTMISSKKTELIGVLHTIKKLDKSFTQKIITRKIKKYLFLNDTLLVRAKKNKNIRLGVFYPLDFPEEQKEIFKAKSEIWIVIPGELEQRRKDLFGSAPLMASLYKQNPNVRFIFLGKSDLLKEDVCGFIDLANKNGFKDAIMLFEDFVDVKTFISYITKADFLWPMVHPNSMSADQYFVNQISGTINLSFSYNIPLLIHQKYSNWDDFKEYAVLYTLNDFSSIIDRSIPNRQGIAEKMAANKKFVPKNQRKQYYDFISC